MHDKGLCNTVSFTHAHRFKNVDGKKQKEQPGGGNASMTNVIGHRKSLERSP